MDRDALDSSIDGRNVQIADSSLSVSALTVAEDAAVLLADFVSSLDNLPSEVHHILQEIGHKEGKTNDIKNRALARDQSLQRHARPAAQGGQGLLVPNPKEDSLITKIRCVAAS